MNIPERDFDAYIFDCDGTLADTMGLHYDAWKMALEPHGADLPEDLYYSWGGRPTREIVEALLVLEKVPPSRPLETGGKAAKPAGA